MGKIAMFDGLRNLVSGLGGGADKASGATYVLRIPTQAEIEACYRGTWLGRKIHDIPALDMTREWRGWQAQDDQIEAIENEEKRLQLRVKVRRAIVLARLYGGSALIMGLPGDPAKPAPDTIGKGGLAYVHLVHRYQLTIGNQDRDLQNLTFGTPQSFMLTGADEHGSVEIHPSRVVAFTGNYLPHGSMSSGSGDWFWGDPLLTAVFEALTSHDTGVAAISALLNEAKVDIVHMPGLMDSLATPEYERTLIERFTIASLLKSITNTLILDGGDGAADSGEKWDQRQIVWTGLPEVQHTLFQLVAGAADIPSTRLLGQAPHGLNSTGESDTRNYYDMLSSLQNSDVGPVLSPLDERLIMSATGSRDPQIFYDWRPLWQMTPKETAERDKLAAETAKVYADMGVIPDDALAVAVQNRLVEDSVFPGLEAALAAAAQQARLSLPPEQRTGVVPGGPPAAGDPNVAPQAANDPNPPKVGNAQPPASGQGRGQAVTALGNNSKRKAANDRARRYVEDRASLSTLNLTDAYLLDDKGSRDDPFSAADPFNDYNPNHVTHGPNGGQFTGKRSTAVAFEVAPNPDNVALLAKWNALTDAEKAAITERMTDKFAPKIMSALGVTGKIENAIGGFEGQINPSRLMVVSDRPFEVAGAIGSVFEQKAMVVMSEAPGPGLSKVGVVSVHLPGGDLAQLRAVEGKLGSYAADGWTHHNGRMQILNFSGKSDVQLANEIDAKLGGSYTVGHGTIYSAYVGNSDYASPKRDSAGNPWGPVSSGLRNAFNAALGQEIAQAGPTGDAAPGQVADYNPSHVQHGTHGGEFTRKGAGLPAMSQAVKEEMALANVGKSLEQLRAEAAANQVAAEKLGEQISREAGIEFHGPPPDSAVKSVESIMRKVRDEGYEGPHQLRDISRVMFVVDNPGQAETALQALSKSGAVYDKGWVKQAETNYLSRYAYMQHANGGVTEIQLVPRGILQVRNGVGHKLYEVVRLPSVSLAERQAAAAQSRDLYSAATGAEFAGLGG